MTVMGFVIVQVIVQTRRNASVAVKGFVVFVETRRDATVMSFGLLAVT